LSYSISQAQPPLTFIPPALNPWVLRFVQGVLPLWLRWQGGIIQVEAEHAERLADLYHQFQDGKIRFLMAFRHPNVDDPACMAYLLSHLVPAAAQRQGQKLRSPVHAHFIYDRGIPLWAGTQVGWLYSRLAGIPIHRGKLDRVGLRVARELFVSGDLPMAAAPEGATNGHGELISPLEPGVAQLGFWCAEDLHKAGRSESVLVVPIGIQYHYVDAPWQELAGLLGQLERDCGIEAAPLPIDGVSIDGIPEVLYERLYNLGQHLLVRMEAFYRRFYHQDLPETDAADLRDRLPNEVFSERLQRLLDVGLKVAEQYFELPAKGNLIDRCRRLEQAGWDRIYRDDLGNLETLPPLERGLADRVAEEADLRMWHMRLVESFVAVTGAYVKQKPTAERFSDTLFLAWDMVTRIKGDKVFPRPKIGQRRVKITIGEPLSVSDRWETYQSSRRAAKQTIADFTQDLQSALETMLL